MAEKLTQAQIAEIVDNGLAGIVLGGTRPAVPVGIADQREAQRIVNGLAGIAYSS